MLGNSNDEAVENQEQQALDDSTATTASTATPSSLKTSTNLSVIDTIKSPPNDSSDQDNQQLAADFDSDHFDKSYPPSNELRQEFSLINKNIPNIEFEELNFLRRVCLVTARFKNVTCRLRIALPPSYPQTECPTFTIIDSANFVGGEPLNKESKDKLLSILDETARSQLARSRNCLEPCPRKFVATPTRYPPVAPIDANQVLQLRKL